MGENDGLRMLSSLVNAFYVVQSAEALYVSRGKLSR